MTLVHRLLLGLAVALLLAPAAFAQKVTYDVAQRHDFGRLQTFAFKAEADDETKGSTAYDSPLVDERTRSAIAAELALRGLRHVDANPDAYVTTRRTFKTETTLYAYPDWGFGYGYGWGYTGWGPGYGGSTWYTDERTIGTLIIDVENARTGQLIWRGIGEKHVHESSSPEHRTKRVNKEVAKIFRKFPMPDVVATSGQSTPEPTGR